MICWSRYLLVLATARLIRTVGIIRAHDCLATLGALGSLGFSIGVYAVFVEVGTTEDHVATDKCFLALFTLGCLGDFITLGHILCARLSSCRLLPQKPTKSLP